jgi:hypothetical protein
VFIKSFGLQVKSGNELRFSINGGLVKMEVEGQYCLYMNFKNVSSVSCRELSLVRQEVDVGTVVNKPTVNICYSV